MKIPEIIKTISEQLKRENAKAIVVGGAIRDHFLELPIKDYDVEVYGLESMDTLEGILNNYGSVNLVGKSFGVLKFSYDGEEYDFSFPRTEQKVALGHDGFLVTTNGSMSFKEASRRRDFTINAMGYDIERQTFIDAYGGREDIQKKLLRHIKSETFIEDSLRVYRAVQFCARFGYRLADETFELCKQMVEQKMLEELPKERIYTEFTKLLLKSPKPSMGFELMRELNILDYFPELKALIGVPQNPQWHPEGDVWTHTLMAVDKMVTLKTGNEKHDLKMMFGVLCHDFGKATHTQIMPDKITAIGHEKAGVEPTKKFLYRITNEHDLIQSVLPLVEYHLAPSIYFKNKAKNSTIRRLSLKVNIEALVTVARADFLGRTTQEALSGEYEAGDWLLAEARALEILNHPPKPFIQGRDLIALGLKPSTAFKLLLDGAYTAQIEGSIATKEEGLVWVLHHSSRFMAI